MARKWTDHAAVALMVGSLGAIAILPFVLPRKAETALAATSPQTDEESEENSDDLPSGSSSGPTDGSSRKGSHGHSLAADEPHWYVTVHGDGDLADVFALDGNGKVIGGILGKPPPPEESTRELRGIRMLGDGRLAVVNAYMGNSRILVYGPADEKYMRPFDRVCVRGGTENPGFLHPYQMTTSPDGTIYISNQDTNTVTRYRGLGSPQAGQPLPIPVGLREFGTLPPGTIVPNSQHSPEGLHEVRGIAWGPDGLLYVADRGANEVVAFDPDNGRRVRVIMDRSDGLGRPIQLLFTPDRQSLLITDNEHDCVWRVNLESRAATQLVKPGSGGLKLPSSMAINNSKLYVGSRGNMSILKYRLSDGRFEGEFAKLKSNPEFMIPVQQK